MVEKLGHLLSGNRRNRSISSRREHVNLELPPQLRPDPGLGALLSAPLDVPVGDCSEIGGQFLGGGPCRPLALGGIASAAWSMTG
jgi:hypothetical protein